MLRYLVSTFLSYRRLHDTIPSKDRVMFHGDIVHLRVISYSYTCGIFGYIQYLRIVYRKAKSVLERKRYRVDRKRSKNPVLKGKEI
jgi:hypothetical protein